MGKRVAMLSISVLAWAITVATLVWTLDRSIAIFLGVYQAGKLLGWW